jgi:hypothetical protein
MQEKESLDNNLGGAGLFGYFSVFCGIIGCKFPAPPSLTYFLILNTIDKNMER